MAQASGDVVALTEDHCIADENWVEALTLSASGDADVVGGGMDNARRSRAVDWAAYFAEYGFFSPERPERAEGPPLLTGANVAYKRHVIADVIGWAQDGEWENVAHTRLVARGSMLRFARTAAIYQNQTYSVAAFCADRYEHGRDYARKRLVEDPERQSLVSAGGESAAAGAPHLARRARLGTFPLGHVSPRAPGDGAFPDGMVGRRGRRISARTVGWLRAEAGRR